jgi:CspA family cold shock protein
MKGTVTWYCPQRGFGFILGENGKKIFIHKSDLPFWTIFLKKGDVVEYQTSSTSKGKKAIQLKVTNKRMQT